MPGPSSFDSWFGMRGGSRFCLSSLASLFKLASTITCARHSANRSLAAHVTAPVRAWVEALIIGLAVLVLLAVLGGYMLVQRALNPVDRIIESAERISSHNLSERLPVPETRDELARLSAALNGMIRRLDSSF